MLQLNDKVILKKHSESGLQKFVPGSIGIVGNIIEKEGEYLYIVYFPAIPRPDNVLQFKGEQYLEKLNEAISKEIDSQVTIKTEDLGTLIYCTLLEYLEHSYNPKLIDTITHKYWYCLLEEDKKKIFSRLEWYVDNRVIKIEVYPEWLQFYYSLKRLIAE